MLTDRQIGMTTVAFQNFAKAPKHGKGKGKYRPRTGFEGPEGEQKYSFTLSLTSALDEVGRQRHAPAAFIPSTHCT